MHEKGELQGAMLTHVDDFVIAGKESFVEKIRMGIAEVLTVSKVERDKFRFTGWDVERFEDVVKVSMKDYANSMN